MKKVEVLREYQEKVVDLSRRNRLLKYPKKARSIVFDLTIEEFQEKFGNLEELSIDFIHKAVFEGEQKENQKLFDEEQLETEKEDIYVPPTNPSGEKLLSTLSALRLDTKRKYEEHGLHTLFLTIGRVKWKELLSGRGSSEATKNEADYDAPLLLVPVEIKEVRHPRKMTTIQIYTDVADVTVNPVLLLLMEMTYGVKVSKPQEDFLDLEKFITNVQKEIVKSFKEAKVQCEMTDEIQLGQYSFYAQQIYEDLKNNEEELVQHEIISALCGNEQISQTNLQVETNPEELLRTEEDYSVLDADVSQLRVIQKVLGGNHLIVQGPPGTGKSQTIVNTVSNLLARGKTVLVVCEKQVALEVVLQRLKKVGLDKLCLPLFYHSSDKKRFAKSLIEDRDFLIRNFPEGRNNTLHSSLEKREESMERLRSYALALGEVVKPLGKTVYWVHGELSRAQSFLQGLTIPWKGPDPLSISHEQYWQITRVLKNLPPVLGVVSQEKFSHWKYIRKMHFSPNYVSSVQSVLVGIGNELKDIKASIEFPESICSIFDVRHCVTFGKRYQSVLRLKTISLPLDTRAELKKACGLVNELMKLVADYRKFVSSKKKKYSLVSAKIPALGVNEIVKKSTSISACNEARRSLDFLRENLHCIEEGSRTLNAPFILDIPLGDVMKNRDILFINPIVNRLKNWQDIKALKPALDNLEPLSAIQEKIEEAKKTINKWAILPTALNNEEVTEIIQRFGQSYKTFFRIFLSQYRNDCKAISNWCNNGTPQNYEEFFEIVHAFDDQINLREKLRSLTNIFIEECIKPGISLETELLPILYSETKKLTEWMYKEGQHEIPSHIEKLIENNTQPQVMRQVAGAFAEVHKILDSSWKIFDIADDIAGVSVTKILQSYEALSIVLESVHSINEQVKSHIIRGEIPQTISELGKDIGLLNEQYSFLEKLEMLPLEDVFSVEKTSVSDFFDNYEELSFIQTALFEATELISSLPALSERSFSMEEIILFSEKLDVCHRDWSEKIADYDILVSELNQLFGSKKSIEDLETGAFFEFYECVMKMSSDVEGLEGWMDYRKYAHQLKDLKQGWFLDSFPENISNENPEALFSQSLWSAWLESHYAKNKVLRDFTLSSHSQLMEQFKVNEKEVLKINAGRILRRNVSRLKEAKLIGGEAERFLVRQSQLQRAHKPVRQVVKQCNSHLQMYKPCWMLSPLTLSSYIPYGEMEFDVIIFDEASQLRVEHALGAISRAKQVVIFGDEHQLPPTSFFQVVNEGEEDETEESQDFESILHASKTILPAADVSLLYHYRSKSEDLIAFSNHYIYNDQLITFPNANVGSRGVSFEYVSDGIFENRRNIKEAERIVQQCAKFATDFPEKSLGVIAFSKSQEVAIRDVLIDWLKQNPNPDIAMKLDENSEEFDGFFIKNLESVQGDERDIIFLSIGYGRDKNGNVYQRFGPINSSQGYRRLNVAVTRAKEKIICVSSLKSYEINPSETARGAKLLQNYLEYAEKGMEVIVASKLAGEGNDAEPDSEFELDVQNALVARGYRVDRQIGASGFKIDLAIVNQENNQEYILGIECDGASYHSSYSARINDRLRQEILEGLGWKIYRVWSQHWISHKDIIVEDIIKSIA